jgi:hypothetical protein
VYSLPYFAAALASRKGRLMHAIRASQSDAGSLYQITVSDCNSRILFGGRGKNDRYRRDILEKNVMQRHAIFGFAPVKGKAAERMPSGFHIILFTIKQTARKEEMLCFVC